MLKMLPCTRPKPDCNPVLPCVHRGWSDQQQRWTRLKHGPAAPLPCSQPAGPRLWTAATAAAAATGTFPWILVYPIFESQSRGKPCCQTASPGCKQPDLRAPPGKCRLPFQGSCPGRRHWSRRGERSWRGKVGEFYFIVFYISNFYFKLKCKNHLCTIHNVINYPHG